MTTRDAYLEKFKARLDELNAELDKLEAHTRSLEADAKLEYEKKLAGLRSQRDAIKERIAQVREASADSWEALKDGAEKALGDLVSALSEAKERLEPALSGR